MKNKQELLQKVKSLRTEAEEIRKHAKTIDKKSLRQIELSKAAKLEKESNLIEDSIDKPCECYGCTHGMEAMLAHEINLLKAVGWFIHYVQGDSDCPNLMNAHTHGLKENFNHPDFQICVPLSQNHVQGLFGMLFNKIKEGKTFESGKDYADLLENNYVVRFINAREGGREVLRMLIPDVDGTYDKSPYKEQFSKLDNL